MASDLEPLRDDFCTQLTCDCDSCLQYIIEPWQVENKLSRIQLSKAPGPDNIPNWLLKEMAPFIAEPISAIFNASIQQSCVPRRWKLANTVPVPKVHPPRDICTDLRPISLTPTLAKILESFVGTWILDTIQHKLGNDQFGALKGRSTTHALVSMTHQWSCALDKGGSSRVLFVDYAKAFDHVDHTILLNKLIALGSPKCLTKWVYSFLKDREQRVKINDIYSEWTTLTGGMPQGTWLGPLTFVILIDDLKPPCAVHKFVDDTTITEILPDRKIPSLMEDSVQYLVTWSKSNNMLINHAKTKEMILGRAKADQIPALFIEGKEIERVSEFKLLGVHISDDLRWESHVNVLYNRVSSRLYFLKLLKRAGVGPYDLLYFYTVVIRPIVEYACVVWHHNLTAGQSAKIESLQKRALRIIHGDLAVGMPYHSLLFLSNIESLQERRIGIGKAFFKKCVRIQVV